MNTLPLVLFLYGSVFFLISLRIQKICIVDVAWALGFLVVMTHSFFVSSFSTYPPAYFILFFMVAIWSLRLGSYLFFRMIHKPDVWRYLELKKEWGKNWKIHTYLKIFIFQNFLLFLCSSTLWYGSSFFKTLLDYFTDFRFSPLVFWFFT